jgi:adenylate cyclase
VPRFLVYHPREGSRVFELLGDRPVSIGRAKSCGLMLDSESISRSHAVVRATLDGNWQIIDRSSVNGVKINGVPVKEATLHANDEVVLGEYRLRYFEDSAGRDVKAYGTVHLPPRFAQVLSEPAYSGSFMPVQPIGHIAAGEERASTNVPERLRALENENRLLTVLYRVTRTLGQLETVEDVTRRIVDLVLEIDGAERGFTMLLDAQSATCRDFSRGGYSFEPAVIRHRADGKASRGAPSLTISQSIIRQVMQVGQPLLITDAQSDPRLVASESVVAAGIQSAMCAPLAVQDRRFGLLYVDNLSRRGMFTLEELNVFAVIASQAGIAIDRVIARAALAAQPETSVEV